MQQHIYGFFAAQTLYVAARLSIADRLAGGAASTAELAAATGAHQPSLYRLLRALVHLGALHEPEPGTFALTAQGELLRADGPDSLRNLILLLSGPPSWNSWGHLEHTVRTGEVAWQHLYGESCFDYLARRPAEQAVFNAAMLESTRAFVPVFLDACDLSGHRTVVDLGGGTGTLLAGVLAAHPRLRGVLFDTADALRDAVAPDRCELVAGNLFEGVPAGGDAYIIKSVLHDFGDDDVVAILSTCREGMPGDAVLYIVEALLPPLVEGVEGISQVVMNDLNMLVCHGGRERTLRELRRLLSAAGFALDSVVRCAAPSVLSVIGARPQG
jgi:hypothetical protein